MRLLVLLLHSSWADDPTCWFFLSREKCCGVDGRTFDLNDKDCWDQSYTPQRCCSTPLTFEDRSSTLPLSLGSNYRHVLEQWVQTCWPDTATQNAQVVFESCCGIQHGVFGKPECFNTLGNWQTFAQCCLTVKVQGLARCDTDPDATKWCSPEIWSPWPIVGLNHGVLDHRAYIGGAEDAVWYKTGQAVFEFLRHEDGGKITPKSYILDIACGPLRVGRHLIPWLEPDRYRGLDRSRWLLEQGYWLELEPRDRMHKRPKLAASSNFEFELLGGSAPPDVSFAISLMTHLSLDDIKQLLVALRQFVRPGHRFFPTYVVRQAGDVNALKSSAVARFRYKFQELSSLGLSLGWRVSNASTRVWHQVIQRVYGSMETNAFRHLMLCFELQ